MVFLEEKTLNHHEKNVNGIHLFEYPVNANGIYYAITLMNKGKSDLDASNVDPSV